METIADQVGPEFRSPLRPIFGLMPVTTGNWSATVAVGGEFPVGLLSTG